MDSGYVIPGLNEEWTLAGAKLNEWSCGIGAFILGQNFFDKPSTAMPVMIAMMLTTALGLAALRKRFPDEEKGLRNYCFMLVGICPPGIPAPAGLQAVWSGAPLRALDEESDFVRLGIDQILEDQAAASEE